MATLEDIEGAVKLQLLSVAGALVLASWSEPMMGPASTSLTGRVWVAQTGVVTVGSNLTVRTAEVVVECWQRAANIWDLDSVEASINDALTDIVDESFWTGATGVRSTPSPEIEIESEPERIGEVLVFAVRASVALEN